jgi:hypothetical protein
MTAQATAINVTATGAVYPSSCTFRGCSIRDTSGSTNTIKIYDNASAASGTVLMAVQLAANASVPPLALADGLRATSGLYLSATGAVEGSVWIG